MYNPVSILIAVIKNSTVKQNTMRPLGRWVLARDFTQQEYTANWASADHCGVCDDHLKIIEQKKG